MIPNNLVEISDSKVRKSTGRVISKENNTGKIKVENKKLLDLNRVEYSHCAILKKFFMVILSLRSYCFSESIL